MAQESQIHTIDVIFQNLSQKIAAHVIPSSDGLIVIDCGPQSSIANLEKGLGKLGHTLADVKHLFITHIHLDHCAGAWELAKHGATVYVHPQGHKHLMNPEKLISSATSIYGDRMSALWGTIEPIAEKQLRAVEDNEEISIGEVQIRTIETPGHAEHHHAYLMGKKLFPGDAAGILLGTEGGVLPPTPPPQLDFSKWQASVDKMLACGADELYLTHFGPSPLSVSEHLNKMRTALEKMEAWTKEHLPSFPPTAEAGDTSHPVYQSLAALCAEITGAENVSDYETINPTEMTLMGLRHFYKKSLERG